MARLADIQVDPDVISGALDARAPLVLSGNYQLDDGMKVRLANTPQGAVAGK